MTGQEQEKADLPEMYRQMPATKIRSETGMTYHAIYRDLREAGVAIRPRGRRPVLENPGREVLEALREYGLSQTDMAKQFGVSKRTVQRWLKD